MSFLDDFPIELICGECGQKTTEKVGRLKVNDTISLACGHTVSTKQFASEIRTAEEALDRFRRDLGNIGKKS